jgi:hypothetical protein
MVMRCARGGCDNTPTILASSGDAVWNLGPIALDASTVYFGHGLFTDGKHQYDGEILACAKTGCAGSPTLVAGSAYGPYRLATDGLHVYWTEQDASLPNSASSPFLLRRCPTTGCGDAPVTLVSGLTGPSDVAVDEAYVYWTDGGSRYDASGRVWRAPK